MSTTRSYYDHYWTDGLSPTGKTLHPEIADLLAQAGAHGALVDVGCGDAGHGGGWAHAHGCSYVGFDVSQSAVDMSVAQGYDARLIDDADQLPLEDASADVVLCMEVLEHLFAPAQAVAEIRRVLRPGGVLLVTVPNIAHWRKRVDLAVLGRWNPEGDELSAHAPWRDPHLRFFAPRTLRAMLASEQMSVRHVGGVPEHLFERIPPLRRWGGEPGPVSTALCRASPTLFASQLTAVAIKG